MSDWTILNSHNVAIAHERLPAGVRPLGSSVPGLGPMGQRYLNGVFEPFTPVPAEITRAQGIGALILAGLDDAVQPAIDAIADPIQRKLAQNDWDNRLTFERTNPTLNALAAAIGMTEEQLDALFIAAAKL